MKAPDDNTAAEWDDWVAVGHYSILEQAYDHGLVILAMGEACKVAEAQIPGEYELHAEAQAAARIAVELDAYGREIASTHKSPFVPSEWQRHSPGYGLCAIWILSLIAMFYWQSQDPSIVRRAASSSVGLIAQGEWWRPFTGLFLHADAPHLVGNLVSGAVFSTLVARSVGALLAWTMIFACGMLGNAFTSWLTYPSAFTSIGASTAVFAALGILSGLGAAESLQDRARLPWLRICAPLLAGIVLLGWLGGGNGANSNTDVLGHVFGFSSGLAAGVMVGTFSNRNRRRLD